MIYLLLFAISLKTTTISTSVDSVILMPRGAVVTRIGKVALNPGDWELVVSDLPLDLNDGTVTVQSISGIKITDVFVTTEKSHSQLEKIRILQEKSDSIAAEIEKIDDNLSVLGVQESLLIVNVDISKYSAISELLKAQMDTTSWSASLKFVGNRLAKIKSRERHLRKTLKSLKSLKDSISNRLQELISQTERTKSIHILAHVERAGKITISYRLDSPSWKPEYEFRATSDGSSIRVVYYASINQRTGEDWKDIKLVISTAYQPAFIELPQFTPQYLSSSHFGRGEALMLAAPAPKAAKAAGTIEAAPSVKQTRLFTLISIPSRVTVPAGDWHKLRIDDFPIASSFKYMAYPFVVSDVFLIAHARNTSSYPLLPGPASLFLDDNFLRKIELSSVPIGDSLVVDYGVDPRIKAVRKLVKKFRSTTWDNKIRIEYRYETDIRNLHENEVTVEVFDRFPVSQDKRIKVKLLDIEPEPDSVYTDIGKIEWKLKVPASGRRKIKFGYIVEYPRNLIIYGLEE